MTQLGRQAHLLRAPTSPMTRNEHAHEMTCEPPELHPMRTPVEASKWVAIDLVIPGGAHLDHGKPRSREQPAPKVMTRGKTTTVRGAGP